MTPSEALAELESDFAPRDTHQAVINECLVPGPVFDALLAVAKAALETVEMMPKGKPESLGGRLAAALDALGEAVSVDA